MINPAPDSAPRDSDLVERMGRVGPAPLYLKVQSAIREAIEVRRFPPDAALPAERELAEELGVSRITIRKALAGLANEGLLSRRQGSGTFVAADSRIEKSMSRITSFTEDMLARNRQPRSEWLGRAEGAVTPEEALSLGLSPGTRVLRFSRIRFADDLPMALETAVIPAACLPSLDAVEASLYGALERHGCRPVRALQRLRAINLDGERAGLLGLEHGAAALLIERRGFHRNGRPVEVTTSYYRGDRYDFLAELSG